MTKNKNLFKNISIFLCLVPMLLLSLFIMVPKNNKINVSAVDRTVTPFTFVASQIVIAMSDCNMSDVYSRTMFCNVNISFGIGESGYYFFDVKGGHNMDSVGGTNWSFVENYDWSVSGIPAGFGESSYWQCTPNYRYRTFFKVKGNLTSSITRVEFGNEEISSGEYYQVVTYYDSFENYIQFKFRIKGSSAILNAFLLSPRSYYLNLGYISDNNYYEAGYTDGYNQGVVDGNDSGYKDGYSAGETVGYNNGYTAGVENGGKYTFASLFGSVIDVPVNAFTSLLNFELLGVNMLGFITGLLTLALIIFIIKLCMGGK